MPKPEHIAILQKGVDVWNQWRKENAGIRPDLTWADLNGANLNGADLNGAHLNGADLIGADLGHADLRGTDLGHADLARADLTRANLHRADLRWADLREADLTGVDLIQADLTRADLTEAVLGYTIIGGLDLSSVIGLETVKHQGPSILGIDTIYRSKGAIPEVFLRGAGVPENFIAYMHSLAGTAFEYYSCFISYSSQDQEFADRLYADLQAKGVRCWLATEDRKIGDKFRKRIDDAIRFQDRLLVVLSETSVASTWVESKIETALERERREKKLILIPIRLDDTVMKTPAAWAVEIRRIPHIGDFSVWQNRNSYHKAFTRLLRDLQGKNAPEVKA